MINNESDLSLQSQGEFKGGTEYEKIEKEIRNRQKKQVSIKENKTQKHGQISNNQQLGEYLSQLQSVSNHNLQVATTYMMQLQQAETQLQRERELAYQAMQEKEHLERKYEYEMDYNKEMIETLQNHNNELKQQNIDYQGETKNALDSINEKNQIIEENKQLIQMLQESLANKEKEQEYLRKQKKEDDLKINNLMLDNKELKLEENAFDYLKEKMKLQEQQYENDLKKLQKEVQEAKQLMLIEVRKREGVIKDQEPLRKEVEHMTEKYEEIKKQYQNIQIENKLISEQHQTLQDTFQEKLKKEVYETQNFNITKMIDLEKKQQLNEQEIDQLQSENNKLKLDVKQKEGEIEFYIKEYKDFDLQMTSMQNEKKQHLLEFHNLKKKYEKLIGELQKKIQELQFNLMQEQEDHKTTKMHLERYVQKVQDMVDMQEMIDVGDKFYANKVKGQALEEHVRSLASKEYDRRTSDVKNELDKYIKTDIQQKSELLNQQDDDFDLEWNSLYNNIQSIDAKINTNQEQLDYLKQNTDKIDY